jgi:hypothetical protein
MNRFFALILLILISGCSLHEDYVRQDRANYETLAPVVRKLLDTSDHYDDDFEKDIEDRLNSWDAWSSSAIASIESDQ